MKNACLLLFVLLAAAPAALAGDGGAWERLWGITFGPTLLMLLALPFAVVVRTLGVPEVLCTVVEERPHVSRLVGAADVVLVLVVAGASDTVTFLKPVALVLLLLLLLAAVLGLRAVAVNLGRRLFRDPARGASVGAFTLAWLLLSGLPLLPVLGFAWFLWMAVAGIGAVPLALRRKEPEALE